MAGVIAQQGDVNRALDLWADSLKASEQIGDVKGKAATLHNMAGVIAQQGDVNRALDLWADSLKLYEQIGDVQGKAATLHQMAGVIAQQGDVNRALDLWAESLKLKEQIGDVQGKAATLHNMAGVIAQQGDVNRALNLWADSLKLKEQIGDVQGKAATLHNMAGVIADQGDVNRALDLWADSLKLKEQIGDVKGKAATLHQMAWAYGREGDTEQEQKLFVEAAKALASVRAWLDLITVLSNLGADESPESIGFLAQALWIAMRVQAPLEKTLSLTAAFVMKTGPAHDAAPLAAACASFQVTARGEGHPKLVDLQQYGAGLLGACAEARGIKDQRKFIEWFRAEGLGNPNLFLPKLQQEIEAMVGEGEWLFDRGDFESG